MKSALLLVAAVCAAAHEFHHGPLRAGLFPKVMPETPRTGVDPGDPLFLTPYIVRGDMETARKMAQVGPLEGYSKTSYSGYMTVDDRYDSNMFFWYFPAQNGNANAPTLLWLQGGPGGSSLFGLFIEHGPISVSKDQKLYAKPHTWNDKYNMLYIDNPVGTGFSFTRNDTGYAKNEVDVANDLYVALTQFFDLFSELQNNDFYVTGESYAGKYVPAISYKIHLEQPNAKIKIPFKGMAIGDGLCDPETMFGYSEYLFQIGMFDEIERDTFKQGTDKAVAYIQQGKFYDAFKLFDMLMNGDLYPYKSYFYNATTSTNYYNYLLTAAPADFDYYNTYLVQPVTRKAIHVGSLPYNDGRKVEEHIVNDIMDTVKPYVASILDAGYKVLMYSGQLDIIVAAPLTESFLATVPWKGLDDYKTADKIVWRVDASDVEVAGYVRVARNLQQVIVRGGGHILPYDQPQRSYDMIHRFVDGKPFTN